MTEQKKIQVKVAPDRIEARYSDFVLISKNALGFNLDFAQRVPAENQVHIVSRIALSPQHAKLLVRLLKQNVENYEQQFGEIKIPEKSKSVKESGVIHFVK